MGVWCCMLPTTVALDVYRRRSACKLPTRASLQDDRCANSVCAEVSRRAWWTDTPRGRALRSPWSVVPRGLGGGALAGALLGGGVPASDVYYRSWDTVAYAAIIGALVVLPAALAAVIGYQAVEVKGVRLAWLAGSLAAAVAVVGIAVVLGVFGVLFTGVCAAVAFVVALACAPTITTRRTSTGRTVQDRDI